MSDARATRRFHILVIAAPLFALALGSFWLLEVMRRATSDFIPDPTRSEPDFYVEKFSYVKMSKTGQAQYHFSGQRLTHNPQDDSYDIQQPVIRNLREARAPITMRAERARINNDNTQVHMYDNVHVDRPGAGITQPLHIRSQYLLLRPDDEIVQTNQAVDITVGASKLTGVGMHANYATREFRLNSNVHGTYQAPAR